MKVTLFALFVGLLMVGCEKEESELERTKRLAEGGDKVAQYNLGVVYAKGRGVPKDAKEAVKWYTKSAEQGHAKAQFNLVMMYKNGEGAPQDYPESVDDLLNYAKEGLIAKAKIQSDPKGGEEWYVIQGNFFNSGFDPESPNNDNHKLLPFLVKGRVTESEYKELRTVLGKSLEEAP